jgi:hypothetical protein
VTAAPPGASAQLTLDLGVDQRQEDIAVIHAATGIYTVIPEVEALLEWPARGQRLLDPGVGNGGFIVAALRRLDLGRDDAGQASWHVKGYEFFPGAVAQARRAVADHLIGRGWSGQAARQAALAIIEETDYLLDPG